MIDKISVAVDQALKEIGQKPVKYQIEHPADLAHGDYAVNVALVLGGGRPLAEKLSAQLHESNLKNIVSEIKVEGPGFINISIRNNGLITLVDQLLSDFLNEGPLKGQKIMVEFAHPNTHKEMHIGHMRTLIVGESLSRILIAAGAQVFRANYQGDIGPHVAKSIWGTEKILKEEKLTWDKAEKLSLTEKAHLLGRGYVKGNQEYEANKDEVDTLNQKLYQHDPAIEPVYQLTRRWSLDYYDQFYQRFDTRFDRLFFESEVADPGKQIVEKNIGNVFEKSQGAIVFPGEKHGLHTRVFVTQDGNPTYEAKDMGLAPLQFDLFAFDRCIHVVANEQAGYFQVIIKALELIDSKFVGREHHLSMGMVNLIGRKISSRTGEIITVDGLLDEVKELLKPLAKNEIALEAVTVGAVKYSVLKTGCEQNVAFDIKKSVSIEGNSGPYLQYTYARCHSVLKKSGEKVKSVSADKLTQAEATLLRTLYRFDEAVNQAAEELAPNVLANFLYDLSQKYNNFYNVETILKAEKDKKEFRLWLTHVTAEVLKKGLYLLGITAPEKM